MNLRGVTVLGEVITFTLTDCPVVVSNCQVALFGKQWSPILDLRTITRGVNGVYEGDIVVDEHTKKEIGYIVFSEGFCIYTLEGNLEKFSTKVHISVKTGNRKTIQMVTALHCRTALDFTYQHLTLTLDSFVTKVGNSLAVRNTTELIAPWKIRFSTGFVDKKKHELISFGQKFCGGVVVLQNMDVCVQYSDGSFELLEGVIRKSLERV